MKSTVVLLSSLLGASALATRNTSPELSLSLGDEQQPLAKHYNDVWLIGTRFHPHYDPHFASRPLPDAEQNDAVRVLIQTCLATLSDLGVEAWLMHGSLLGWWWGQRVLPWDSDADIQISENGLSFLAAYYNMTMFFYQYSGVPEGRRFRLQVNPHYKDATIDPDNAVDARWIDMQTGLYVDITGLRHMTNADGSPAKMLHDKSGDVYAENSIFPLRETMFEGVHAFIPYSFKDVIANKYGDKALTDTEFNDHVFNEKIMQWEPKTTIKEAQVEL
ncbi:hypothetical protein TD95_001168 [Thielaviopsis punctulata]|uniref:LicD/FKTN/FKRP nucleotidyltransferase domain-containing protein n=1 Tax=Thielaviopsis punctulata TaxID=72032 RepID=A0A0F4ZJ06_9PEZI|nr:hypothetical protein TD95_001168 [Thielaviopsis punctulata]